MKNAESRAEHKHKRCRKAANRTRCDALFLSLLVAMAQSPYDTRSNELTQMSADFVVLDRLLVHYGPETKEANAQTPFDRRTGPADRER